WVSRVLVQGLKCDAAHMATYHTFPASNPAFLAHLKSHWEYHVADHSVVIVHRPNRSMRGGCMRFSKLLSCSAPSSRASSDRMIDVKTRLTSTLPFCCRPPG